MNDEPQTTTVACHADASGVESPTACAEDTSTGASTNTLGKPAAEISKAEFGGTKGLEPTRYGDWERNGRCYDF